MIYCYRTVLVSINVLCMISVTETQRHPMQSILLQTGVSVCALFTNKNQSNASEYSEHCDNAVSAVIGVTSAIKLWTLTLCFRFSDFSWECNQIIVFFTVCELVCWCSSTVKSCFNATHFEMHQIWRYPAILITKNQYLNLFIEVFFAYIRKIKLIESLGWYLFQWKCIAHQFLSKHSSHPATNTKTKSHIFSFYLMLAIVIYAMSISPRRVFHK